MSHRRAALYLQIPAAYCRSFGGLRWAQYGEAIEFLDGPDAGRTFAFAAEVGQFLEGLIAPGGPCPAFGTALHLLYMLGLGDRATGDGRGASDRKERLAGPFRHLGSPLRNAGALCAWLYRSLPGVADPPRLTDVLQLLNGGSWIPQMVLTHPMLGAIDYAEQPPADPSTLDAAVDAGLAALSDEAIGHWLKFGRGPLGEGDRITVPLPLWGPAGTLAQIEERPRLAGLTRLRGRLEGALSLPPRRLEHDGPQTDGYWDLTTRGAPEQILPIQFALESEEFLRRFAGRELLYFHRERPTRAVSQEIILVLDQGIRTWGSVRLVLAGAAMALARQARRRKLAVWLLTTGRDEPAVDPVSLDSESLGELLEGSDFTAHPARPLARVLRSGPGAPRDVVLLTHPRNLAEADVIEAARQLEDRDATRVFAVAVDPSGQVELAELRRGRPVAISRCRVELSDATAPAHPATELATTGRRFPWRGEVEPIPFPFRCGLLAPGKRDGAIGGRLIDFDEGGRRILAITQRAHLATFEVDGSDAEILPLPTLQGESIRPTRSVIGVAGGFVMVGGPVLAHYDFPTRTCVVHMLRSLVELQGPVSWFYYADLHSIVARSAGDKGPCPSVDLSASGEESSRTSRAARAAERARAGIPPYPLPAARLETHASEPWGDSSCVGVELDAGTGELQVRRVSGGLSSVVPMTDGRPALKGARVLSAQQGGDVLAVQVEAVSSADFWFVSLSRTAVMGSFESGLDRTTRGWFALSRDGQRFARLVHPDQVEVRDVPGDRPPLLLTPQERLRVHFASLGKSCLLVREFHPVGPRLPHGYALVRWDREQLEVDRDDPVRVCQQLGGVIADSRSLPPESLPSRYDRARFVQFVSHGRLRVLIDQYNHVAIFGPDDGLIAMFYMSGEDFAAWMPGGTKFGSSRLIGGGPSPDAARRIAAALRLAECGEGGTR